MLLLLRSRRAERGVCTYVRARDRLGKKIRASHLAKGNWCERASGQACACACERLTHTACHLFIFSCCDFVYVCSIFAAAFCANATPNSSLAFHVFCLILFPIIITKQINVDCILFFNERSGYFYFCSFRYRFSRPFRTKKNIGKMRAMYNRHERRRR